MIDRALAEQEAALDIAYLPLTRLLAMSARLSRAPPLVSLAMPGRRDRMARLAALAAALRTGIGVRCDGQRRMIVALAALHLRMAGSLPALPGRPPVYRLPLTAWAVAEAPDPADLALIAGSGAPVSAPADGRIAYAGSFRRYGDMVILDHGHGWTTILSGLRAIGVRAGRRVVGGDQIGRMGKGGAILVLELRHHGRPIDVARMLASPG